MTIEQLGQAVKSKYPQYNNLSDTEVGQKVLIKYPQYQSRVDNNTHQSQSPNQDQNIFSKAADIINKGYNAYANAPVIKQATQLVGLGVGALGGVIGGVVGGVAETGKQLASGLSGNGFDGSKILQSAKDTAKSTAGFGYDIGKSGTAAAGLGAGGKLIQGAVAYGQGYQGVQDVKSGIKNNDPAQALQGGLELGTSFMAAKGSLNTKGWLIEKNTLPVIKDIASQAVAKTKGVITPVLENKLTNIATELTKMTTKQTKLEVKWGKNTPQFLVKENVLPDIKSVGNRLDTNEAVSSLQQKYQAENQSFNQVLKDSGQYISLENLRKNALNNIDTSLKARGSDLSKAQDFINTEIDALKHNYRSEGIKQGNDILLPADTFNNIKSGFWQKSSVARKVPGAELNADLNYQLGHEGKDIISSTIKDANINSMNERLGNFAQAIKVLDNANGKVVPGGFIGKQFTRLAGTIAGATTGLPGAILGNLTGGKLADLAANPQIRTGLLSKVYSQLTKTEKGKTIIDEAQSILQQRADQRASRKLLESPKAIPLGGKSDTSRLFTQEEAKLLLDSLKIKTPPKLIKAPAGDKTNPIILQAPKK